MLHWFSARRKSIGLAPLLIATIALNGCVSATYVKEPEPITRAGLGAWYPLWKESRNKNELSEASVSKIVQQIKDRATPEEWAAVQCLSGVTVDYGTVTQHESADLLQLLGVTRALSALPDSSPQCRDIRLLDVEMIFLRDFLQAESPWNVVWLVPWALVCGGSFFTICPLKSDRLVRISAVVESAQGCRILAEGLGAVTWLAPGILANDDNAAIIALAEALKAMATNLKEEIGKPCQPAVPPVQQDDATRPESPSSTIKYSE